MTRMNTIVGGDGVCLRLVAGSSNVQSLHHARHTTMYVLVLSMCSSWDSPTSDISMTAAKPAPLLYVYMHLHMYIIPSSLFLLVGSMWKAKKKSQKKQKDI
jgi:hypothetical protein